MNNATTRQGVFSGDWPLEHPHLSDLTVLGPVGVSLTSPNLRAAGVLSTTRSQAAPRLVVGELGAASSRFFDKTQAIRGTSASKELS